jgi:hypothetical protein
MLCFAFHFGLICTCRVCHHHVSVSMSADRRANSVGQQTSKSPKLFFLKLERYSRPIPTEDT